MRNVWNNLSEFNQMACLIDSTVFVRKDKKCNQLTLCERSKKNKQKPFHCLAIVFIKTERKTITKSNPNRKWLGNWNQWGTNTHKKWKNKTFSICYLAHIEYVDILTFDVCVNNERSSSLRMALLSCETFQRTAILISYKIETEDDF